jgi:biopolymer transport protein ExbB
MWDFFLEISRRSLYLIPIMVLLLILTIAVIVERLYFFHRVLRAGESMDHDIRLVRSENVSDLTKVANHYEGTVQAGVLETALASFSQDAAAMERQIDEAIMWQLPTMDRHLWVLDTAVTLGPLLGLLGTIFGMIESFSLLRIGGSGDPNAVTGGIAHALIATALGLAIAIVAVAFHNYFHKRLRLALHQMDLVKVMVINRLQGAR